MTIRSLVSGTTAIVHTAGCGVLVAVLALADAPAAAQLRSTINSRELLGMDPLDLIRLVDESRPPPVSAAVRAHALSGLPRKVEIQNFEDGERRKLAALVPVLDAAQRGSAYEIKVIDAPYAFVGLYERTAVLITRPVLKVLSEQELRAVVAHETAHEYVHGEYERAMAADQRGRLQDLELICDIIATVILRSIGQEAQSLPAGIFKMEQFNRSRFGYEVDPAYPSLLLRRSVVLALEKRISHVAELR